MNCKIFFSFLFSLFLSSCQQSAKNSQDVQLQGVIEEQVLVSIPKVSVICPTYNRPERHANLYAAFVHQSYPNCELVVLDDSPQPSPFFVNLKDSRVIYKHILEKCSVGKKRNLLLEMLSGEIIAHFDDDDFYAPEYLTTMVEYLGAADFVKLSRWFAWRESDKTLWEWDTRVVDHLHYVVSGSEPLQCGDLKAQLTEDQANQWIDANKWGYGFSYVYRRELLEKYPYEDTINGTEDYKFVLRLRQAGRNLKEVPDEKRIVFHVIQPKCVSRIIPQYYHGTSKNQELFPDAGPWFSFTTDAQDISPW